MPRLSRLDSHGVLHHVMGRRIDTEYGRMVGGSFKPRGLRQAADQRILGDGAFVEQIISGLDDLVKKNLRLSGQRVDLNGLA